MRWCCLTGQLQLPPDISLVPRKEGCTTVLGVIRSRLRRSKNAKEQVGVAFLNDSVPVTITLLREASLLLGTLKSW